MFIDTHCHLDFDVFCDHLEDILAEAASRDVVKMVVPGVTESNWHRVQRICADSQGLLVPSYGLHPCFCEQHKDDHLQALIELCKAAPPVAIGEIGLDYFIDSPDLTRQMDLFKAQIEIAKDFGLPVIVHCRKAHDQCLKAVADLKFDQGGIIHAYSGSLEQAKRFVKMGFKLGMGGGATYDRAKKLHRILNALPLSSFVLETDAPDIPPSFARGEPNSPINLPEIAAIIASHMGISIESLAESTTANAKSVLRL